MRHVTVLNRQNLFDIAIQEYGSVEAAIDLLLDDTNANRTQGAMLQLGLMSPIQAGQKVKIITAPLNKEVFEYYRQNELHPISDFEFTPLPGQITRDFNTPDFHQHDYI